MCCPQKVPPTINQSTIPWPPPPPPWPAPNEVRNPLRSRLFTLLPLSASISPSISLSASPPSSSSTSSTALRSLESTADVALCSLPYSPLLHVAMGWRPSTEESPIRSYLAHNTIAFAPTDGCPVCAVIYRSRRIQHRPCLSRSLPAHPLRLESIHTPHVNAADIPAPHDGGWQRHIA